MGKIYILYRFTYAHVKKLSDDILIMTKFLTVVCEMRQGIVNRCAE